MKRHCLNCRAVILSGSYCAACRPRNGSTRAWRKLRELILASDHDVCQLPHATTEAVEPERAAIGRREDEHVCPQRCRELLECGQGPRRERHLAAAAAGLAQLDDPNRRALALAAGVLTKHASDPEGAVAAAAIPPQNVHGVLQ